MPSYKLAIIGDGELRHECEQLLKEYKLSKSVILYGTLPHAEALNVIAESMIFIMNSVTAQSGDKEGTPVSLIEAMTAGLIPIATKHGGIMDIIEDGVTGFLYDEYDYDALCKLMLEVPNRDSMETIAVNAKEYAMQNLDESIKTANLKAMIRESISAWTYTK